MNKKSYTYLILAILLSIFQLHSQSTNYSIKKINNKEYYAYTVQASEGLYAISKRFNVSQAEITELNPGIESGLKVSQEIIIPINSANKALAKAEKSEKTQANDFIEHTVLKKQTLFAISQTYKVSISDIQAANPQIVTGLQEGMILKIPKTKADTLKTKANNTKIENNTVKQHDKNKINSIPESPEFIEHRVKLK